MELNKQTISFLSLTALVFLPGCLRVPSYKPRTLQFMHSKRMHRQVKENVILQVKELSEDERAYLFGERIGKLENKEYTMLYFSIHNLSRTYYTILSDFIDVNLIPYSKVIQQLKTSTFGRMAISGAGVAGATIAGVYSSEAILLSLTIAPFLMPFCLFFAPVSAITGAVVGLGCAALAGTFGGKTIKSSVINNRIKKDLKKKLVHENSSILAGGFYEGLIFVKTSDYKSNFTIRLHEKNTASGIQFNVSL